MRRVSWLDNLVYTFQHRWETNSRFRAASSGVIALAFALLLCSCVGVMSMATNSVLASVGAGGGGGGGHANTGTGKLASSTAFPTYTLPAFSSAGVPAVSPIASSQTPAPVPTEPPTATPQPTSGPCAGNCGGGGGGGNVKVTASYSPSVWHGGQTGIIYIHTSQPNIGVGFLISFPNGATQTIEPAGQTDGNGDFSYSEPIPSPMTSGNAQVLIFDSAGSPGVPSATLSIPCAP